MMRVKSLSLLIFVDNNNNNNRGCTNFFFPPGEIERENGKHKSKL
jgi:hypothetical protein